MHHIASIPSHAIGLGGAAAGGACTGAGAPPVQPHQRSLDCTGNQGCPHCSGSTAERCAVQGRIPTPVTHSRVRAVDQPCTCKPTLKPAAFILTWSRAMCMPKCIKAAALYLKVRFATRGICGSQTWHAGGHCCGCLHACMHCTKSMQCLMAMLKLHGHAGDIRDHTLHPLRQDTAMHALLASMRSTRRTAMTLMTASTTVTMTASGATSAQALHVSA